MWVIYVGGQFDHMVYTFYSKIFVMTRIRNLDTFLTAHTPTPCIGITGPLDHKQTKILLVAVMKWLQKMLHTKIEIDDVELKVRK